MSYIEYIDDQKWNSSMLEDKNIFFCLSPLINIRFSIIINSYIMECDLDGGTMGIHFKVTRKLNVIRFITG